MRPRRKRIPIEIVDSSPQAQDLSKEARLKNTSGNQSSSSGFFTEISSRALKSNDQDGTTAPSAGGVAKAVPAQSTFDPSSNPTHSERKQTPNGGIFRTTNTVPPTETPSTDISIPNNGVADSVDHTISTSNNWDGGSRSIRPPPSSFYDFVKEWNTASSDQDKWLVFSVCSSLLTRS